MTVAAIGVGVATAAVAAGANAYSQSQQNKAAKKAQAFQSDPANRTTTETHELPPWLLPYAKAYVERQWIDSSKPYTPYQGFFQGLSKAQQAEKPRMPWEMLSGPQPSQLPQNPAFRPKVAGIPFNPLTARQGEVLPMQVAQKDYQRYMQSVLDPNAPDISAMGGAEQKAWKKANGKLQKFMNAPILLGSGAPYGGLLSNQFTQAQQQGAPNALDQYLALRTLKGG